MQKSVIYLKTIIYAFICTFLQISNNVLFSQQDNTITFTIKDGLPSNNVYSIKQDKKGFIWATTDKGVVSFDGKKIKLFTTAIGLASNDNFSMLLDSKDNVWLYSFKAISKIEPNGKISCFGDTKSYYGQFLINRKDQIFYSVLDISISDRNRRSFQNILIKENLLENLTNKYLSKGDLGESYFYFDNDSIKYFGFYLSDCIQINLSLKNDFSKKKMINLDYTKKNLFGYGNFIPDFIKYNDSLSLTFGELSYYVNLQNCIFKQKNYPKNIRKFTNGNIIKLDNLLLVVFDKGIFKFDPINDVWNIFVLKEKCTSILKDYEGNIWISTLGDGIIKFAGYSKSNGLADQKILSTDIIHKMNGFKDQSLWVANSKNEIEDLISKKSFNPSELKDLRFIETDGKNLFFGGSNAIFKNGKKFGEFGFKNISLFKDTIAIVSSFGINFMNVNKLQNFKMANDEQFVDILGRNYAILYLSHGFYTGNLNGLYYGHPSKNELIPVCLDDETETISVNGIKQTSDGLIWVSTEGNGVYVLKDNIRIMQFNAQLLDGNIHSMKIDEKDNVWLSTRFGVNKIYKNKNDYHIKKYTSFHGLPSDYVFDTYCYNDVLYVATDEGLVKLNVAETDAQNWDFKPPVYITDAAYDVNGLYYKMKIDSSYALSYDQNSISISFTGISYRSNGNVKYEYRLLPSFSDWRTSSSQTINFDDLAPGNYKFEVVAINAIGAKSSLPAVFDFKINKHFTQEIWFIMLVFLSIVSVVAFYVLSYFKNKRLKAIEQSRVEKLISELKLKSLQAQLNPHFIFNSLNAIQQFVNSENKKSANDYLARFSRLMRLYLIGSDSQFITLGQELEVLKLYCALEHLRFSDLFDYNIDIDPSIDLKGYYVPAMLLQPHVENAIRHGLIPDSKVHRLLDINISANESGVICTIQDNGIGRTKSLEIKNKLRPNHRSMGNKISKERLEMIRSLKLAYISETITDLKDAEGNITGTKVEILIAKSDAIPQSISSILENE